MRLSSIVRAMGVFAAVGTVLFIGASPAGAVTVNGPCSGTATINGKQYTTANKDDASLSHPMTLPKTGTVTYEGTTGAVTKPEHGHLSVVVGPAEVSIYSWRSSNTGNKTTDTGTKSLTSASKKLPGIAGIYELKGYHYNNGALYCSGSGYIKFTDSPLTTPLGIVAVAGTAVAALVVLIAALGKGVRA
jgi:hypothetical protein